LKADWDRAARDVEWAEAQLERALTE
jgi:hypothetical protein